MTDQETHTIDNILTPLALTVIIDNKVRDPEMSAFIEQSQGILEMLELHHGVDEDRIVSWFSANEQHIKTSIAGRKKNTFVLKTLTRFNGEDALIEALYDAMLAISISDKEYHVEESELIKSAASLWGYTRPPFKILSNK